MAKDLLEKIKAPIESNLQSFKDMYDAYTENSIPLIKEIASYVNSSKGKQIRPIFTLLSAGLYGAITDKTIRASLTLELLHTATLAHDDVVDNSDLRRHKKTVNAVWGNKIAILAGDFYLTVLFEILTRNKDYDLLAIVSDTVKQIIEGEFLQQQKSIQLDYSEENYFDIIFKKTAVLIAACCKSGALSTGASVIEADRMYEVGKILGLAFQVKDDILDYSLDSKSGKTPGNDIKELKFTLPLIYYFQTISEEQRKELLDDLKNRNTDDLFISELINKVISAGGVKYAEDKVYELCNQVRQKIDKIEPSTYKDAFLEAIDYVSIREQ